MHLFPDLYVLAEQVLFAVPLHLYPLGHVTHLFPEMYVLVAQVLVLHLSPPNLVVPTM